MKPFLVCVLILAVALPGCSRRERKAAIATDTTAKIVPLKYARGFSIRRQGPFTRLEVTRPYMGASSGRAYLLAPADAPSPPAAPGVTIIRTPVSDIVCTSTTHIPLLDYLGVSDALVGFPGTDYISSPAVRKRIAEGLVTDLGMDKGMNLEQLLVLDPQVVMGYTMSADYGQFRKIEELGIPVVLNAEYLEEHPLGRAEWIKFMGALFNQEERADSVFNAIEQTYLETAALAGSVDEKPTVLSGILYGDAWFLPGGKNYAARLLRDAGCTYLWQADSTTGYLELAFEAVFARARDAEYWIGVGPYASMDALGSGDHRYQKFKAFRTGNVFGYDARLGEKGGNEMLELGYLRADIVLKDLLKITHPDLLPDHHLYFHRKLP